MLKNSSNRANKLTWRLFIPYCRYLNCSWVPITLRNSRSTLKLFVCRWSINFGILICHQCSWQVWNCFTLRPRDPFSTRRWSLTYHSRCSTQARLTSKMLYDSYRYWTTRAHLCYTLSQKTRSSLHRLRIKMHWRTMWKKYWPKTVDLKYLTVK